MASIVWVSIRGRSSVSTTLQKSVLSSSKIKPWQNPPPSKFVQFSGSNFTTTGGRRLFSSGTTTIARNTVLRGGKRPVFWTEQHVVAAAGASFSTVAMKIINTNCDSPMIAGAQDDSEIAHIYQRALQERKTRALALQKGGNHYWKRVAVNIKRGWKMLIRAIKLMVTLSPVVALYPISQMLYKRDPNLKAHDMALAEDADKPVGGPLGWYLQICLTCVEWSGAAVIKLMQWAGSRPDMFGHEFCSVFSRLQDDTTPHAWRHTEKVLREAYGENWKEFLTIHQDEILGSGCIGQVYKGKVKNKQNNGEDEPVAVKVMHPSVEEDIDADLDLLRFFVRAIQKMPFFSGLKWLNLEGAVEEFADMLKLQLDCRVEAANLERFNENFKDSEDVVFPKLIDGFEPSKDVLIETFVQGMPVVQFAKEHRENQELLHNMCVVGIKAVCKMIFLDNFMHGDLHPGNVFIDPQNKKFILFDVGIVAAYTEEDHDLIEGILTAFIRRQGRKAGRLMIDNSNKLLADADSEYHAIDEEKFIDKIEMMNREATRQDRVMENLGVYISQICNAASTHHVMINQAFVSAALAVKVQEGIAIALDPSIEIWRHAIPIIWESERQRGKVKKNLFTLLGLDRIFNIHPEPDSPSS